MRIPFTEKLDNSISIGIGGVPTNYKEASKGKVPKNTVKFPSELGEAHLFDLAIADDLYKNFGLVTAVIDKYVDFIIGPGHFIKIDENDELAKKAKVILDDWENDIGADSLLRAWTKEALKKGQGYMEIAGIGGGIERAKILDAKYMYKKINDEGEVEEYNQYAGAFDKIDKTKIIPIEPEDIAEISFNKTGNDAYGIGIIYPTVKIIDSFLGNRKERDILLKRKANSPYHVKLGNAEKRILPKDSDVEAFGQKLEWLNNKHEWVTGPDVEIKSIDFGNLGDKFNASIESDEELLFYSYQVPAVLMGKGSIPEGLAKVQLRAFQMRINSFQEEIKKVMETQIYKRILESHGFSAKVEVVWGMPDDSETNDRIDRIKEIMKSPTISMTAAEMLEAETMKLLEIDMDEYNKRLDEEKKKDEEERKKIEAQMNQIETEDEEEKLNPEREKEETASLPKVPGEEREHLHEACDFSICNEGADFDKDYSLKEWLGFDYQSLKDNIKNVISTDRFKFLRAITKQDQMLGLLRETQINKLRGVLHEAFDKGKSVRWIEGQIKNKVKPGSRYRIANNGKVVKSVSDRLRPILIARTETTRVASEGTLNSYKEKDVEKVRWLSSGGERTCPECDDMNGQIMTLDEASGMIPLHAMCRCFIDFQTPVYTSKGWEQIGKIKKGDLVLTHRGKFKLVTDIMPRIRYHDKIISIETEKYNMVKGAKRKGIKLSTTPEHSHYIQGKGWVRADKIEIGDNLVVLGKKCIECGNLFPHMVHYENSNFCSSKCANRYTANIQFKDKYQHEIRSIKATQQMQREYADGTRDRFEIVKKAQEKSKELWDEGIHPLIDWHKSNDIWNKGKTKYDNESLAKLSNDRIGKGNPMHKSKHDKEYWEKVSQRQKQYWRENPEKHPNRKMPNVSIPQRKMFEHLKLYYPDAELEYSVKTNKSVRFIDVAIPSLKIGCEYDGEYWHKNREKEDLQRDKELAEVGWTILHFNKKNIENNLKEFCLVEKNHTNQYEFMTMKIKKTNEWYPKRGKTLYNFSVADDESYIVKGAVTHNCTWTPITELSKL